MLLGKVMFYVVGRRYSNHLGINTFIAYPKIEI